MPLDLPVLVLVLDLKPFVNLLRDYSVRDLLFALLGQYDRYFVFRDTHDALNFALTQLVTLQVEVLHGD